MLMKSSPQASTQISRRVWQTSQYQYMDSREDLDSTCCREDREDPRQADTCDEELFTFEGRAGSRVLKRTQEVCRSSVQNKKRRQTQDVVRHLDRGTSEELTQRKRKRYNISNSTEHTLGMQSKVAVSPLTFQLGNSSLRS